MKCSVILLQKKKKKKQTIYLITSWAQLRSAISGISSSSMLKEKTVHSECGLIFTVRNSPPPLHRNSAFPQIKNAISPRIFSIEFHVAIKNDIILGFFCRVSQKFVPFERILTHVPLTRPYRVRSQNVLCQVRVINRLAIYKLIANFALG